MNSTWHSIARIMSLSAALLCVVLASANQDGLSNGLLKKPSVELHASKTLITYGCPASMLSRSGSCPPIYDVNVELESITKDFNKQALYVYTVTGGRIVGEGKNVVWDLSEAWFGVHTATVEVRDNNKDRALSSVTVKIAFCGDCIHIEPCGTMYVNCYDAVKSGTPITCKVMRQEGYHAGSPRITYEWSARASNGEDLSERIRVSGDYVSIPTEGLGGRTVYTRVEAKGLDLSCNHSAEGSTVVRP